MNVSSELTGVLREVVQFLECLRKVKLPAPLENIRDNLLIRSKQTITSFMAERNVNRTQTTPGTYLDMTVIASKGLVTVNETNTVLQEYVGPEEYPRRSQQDYYETCLTVESNYITKDEITEQTDRLLEIYANFSATQTKAKSLKCGSLYKNEGKKLFGIGQYRSCWVGLIGSCLLIYGNDRDNRPHEVLPIRGYQARPALHVVSKDPRRNECTFEIFCSDSKSIHTNEHPANKIFVARSRKDMEQWIVKISEMGKVEKNENTESSKVSTAVSNEANVRLVPNRVEEHRNSIDEATSEYAANPAGTDSDTIDSSPMNFSSPASSTVASLIFDAASVNDSGPIPPLPARIPRRLPSLPTSPHVHDEEDEGNMYSKIEDFEYMRDQHSYDNVPINKPNKVRGNQVRSNTKDPVATEKSKRNSERGSLYDCGNDNASSTATALNKNNVDHVHQEECYDDVESVSLSLRSSNEQQSTTVPDKLVRQNYSLNKLQKKSFLDRMRGPKKFPRKMGKNQVTKYNTLTLPVTNDQQLPTYDEVVPFVNTRPVKRAICPEIDESEYNFPPPPRPVYVNFPKAVDSTDHEEIYDDVSSYRNNHKEQETQSASVTPRQTNSSQESTPRNLDDSVPRKNICRPKSQTSVQTLDHYQTPRSNSNQLKCSNNQEEELYDDVAILSQCIARQKEFKDRKDVAKTSRVQVPTEKRSRNRFVGEKKPKSTDSITGSKMIPQNWNGNERADDHAATKKNTIKKLINKMENSLGKTSV